MLTPESVMTSGQADSRHSWVLLRHVRQADRTLSRKAPQHQTRCAALAVFQPLPIHQQPRLPHNQNSPRQPRPKHAAFQCSPQLFKRHRSHVTLSTDTFRQGALNRRRSRRKSRKMHSYIVKTCFLVIMSSNEELLGQLKKCRNSAIETANSATTVNN